MKKCLLVLGGFLATSVLPIFSMRPASADTPAPASGIVISEVQTGGCAVDAITADRTSCPDADQVPDMEFIELHNLQSNDFQLQGWKVQYVSSSGKTITTLADLDGVIAANGYILLAHGGHADGADLAFGQASDSGELASSAGYVQIADTTGNVVDAVGWGSSLSAPQLSSWPATSQIPFGYSIKRILPGDPLYAGGQIFSAPTWPTTPQGGDFAPTPETGDKSDDTENPPAQQKITCEGIVMTELLPNPAGADTGHEFIELYNPTNANISLSGCSLQTTASSKVFNFGNVSLHSKQYHAFYNSETGLTLPNSAGGTAWLLSPTEELQAINYPGNLDDGIAWALSGNAWHATYKPSPNAVNIIESSKPCPSGEVRNPATGYCHNIDTLTTSTLSICPAGKVRNPDTNRCRSITSSGSSLTPCKPGQTRNPATNRCKAIATLASASLKPCAPGQERNPATHRCRKTTSANGSNLANVKDVASSTVGSDAHWWLAGLAAAGATSYGIYEWRQEALQFLSRFKTKLRRSL